MTHYKIHPAVAGDMVRISPLLLELPDFQNAPVSRPLAEFAMAVERDGPAGRRYFECLIADTQDGQAVGFILFNVSFDIASLGRKLFMHALFVAETARDDGVGKLLMIALAKHCVAQNISRVDWHVDRLDLHARTFFELISPDSFRLNRLSYGMDSQDITALASQPMKRT